MLIRTTTASRSQRHHLPYDLHSKALLTHLCCNAPPGLRHPPPNHSQLCTPSHPLHCALRLRHHTAFATRSQRSLFTVRVSHQAKTSTCLSTTLPHDQPRLSLCVPPNPPSLPSPLPRTPPMSAFISHAPFLASNPVHPSSPPSLPRLHPPLHHAYVRRTRSHMCTPSPSPPPSSSTDSTPASEVPFEIRGFSLANVFLAAGAIVTIYSFSVYFNSNGTASATSLGFVYGVPILLIGCALKYAELQPIEVKSFDGAREIREKRATDTQKKIYSDITRHRYGDEAHLSAALAALGLVPRGEACPELVRGEEKVVDGEYELKLVFYSVATPWAEWQGKTDKFERFFGPGVSAEVEKVDSEKRLVALKLRSGKGKEGKRGEGAGKELSGSSLSE